MIHAATRIGEISGQNILTITTDIEVEGHLSAAYHRVVRSLKRIDLVVVYGAGQEARACFNHSQKYALPRMVEQGEGLILQIDPGTGGLLRYRNVNASDSTTATDTLTEPISDIEACDNIIILISDLLNA